MSKMKKELFKLALHGLKGKKRSSLLTVIILTISFAAVLVTLCITGSIDVYKRQGLIRPFRLSLTAST